MSVLKEWFNDYRASHRDVIVKLHTGQGKTLIRLLMLQTMLGMTQRDLRFIYVHDNFLIEQTCDQARQFGIITCTTGAEFPEEFLNGEKILVTWIQKLFNGLTRFGLNHRSIKVGSLLMDDAHACADKIRQACRIRIPAGETAYSAMMTLSTEIKNDKV